MLGPMSVPDDLEWLRLLVEWGADDALEPLAVDRLSPRSEATPERPVRPAPTPTAGRPAAVASASLAGTARTLAELETAVAGFTLCPLRDTAGALAFADGPEDARLVTVIDAPSAEDDANGRPLSGALGEFFGRMLASIDIGRPSVRVATLVPWRPPGDRPANATENATCLPFLLAHLRLLRPATLLVAGGAATRLLAGSAGSARKRAGTWTTVAVEGPVAGTQHEIPALLLPSIGEIRAEPTLRKAVWHGLLGLRLRLDGIAGSTFTSQ